jgi:hypothetical protein
MRRLDAEWTKPGKPHDFYFYPGAGWVVKGKR